MTQDLADRRHARPSAPADTGGPGAPPGQRASTVGVLALTAALVVLTLGQARLQGLFQSPAVGTWATMFVSIVVQALPFLVLGVLLSACLTAFVPSSALRGVLPRRPALAVPVAGAAGAVLPGCECASVPLAAGLMRRGVPTAAALAFLLSAPAINPIVLVSTAVAFPGRPDMVGARLLASLAVALTMGWLWLRLGRGRPPVLPPRKVINEHAGRLTAFRAAAGHDLLHTGGFLVLGGITAATLNVAVPRSALDGVAADAVLSVLCLALLAVVLALCSEADAFVAASLTNFSLTARLTFLVVGPAVDVKLIALQSGTFGRRFTLWFAPITFAVAVAASVTVGWCLL